MGRAGLIINMKSDGTTELSGEGIDNLKNQLKSEIIKQIQEEIIKPENDKIRAELFELRDAILKSDKSLLRRTIESLINKGLDNAIEIIIKIIFAKSGF